MTFLRIVFVPLVTLNTLLVSTFAHTTKRNESCWRNEVPTIEPCDFGQHYLDKGLCVDNCYRIGEPPFGNVPVVTTVSKMEILEVSGKDKVIEIELGIFTHWWDGRMKINPFWANIPPHSFFAYYDEILPPIWTPVGTKRENVRGEKSLQDPYMYMVIFQDDDPPIPNATCGVGTYNEYQLSLFCDFKFTDFPMDTHSCQFLETNENNRQLQLISKNENGSFPLSEKDGFEIEISFVQGDGFGSKNLSYWGFNLRLKRIYSSYVFQYYLPVSAIVLLSQISFIIPPSSIPGRLGFLATLFLTLMNISINQMAENPIGSKRNALCIYLLASLTFVIGSILEFAVIMFLQRQNQLKREAKVASTNNVMLRRASFDVNTLSAKIDGIALIIFLSGYILFIALYWFVFTIRL